MKRFLVSLTVRSTLLSVDDISRILRTDPDSGSTDRQGDLSTFWILLSPVKDGSVIEVFAGLKAELFVPGLLELARLQATLELDIAVIFDTGMGSADVPLEILQFAVEYSISVRFVAYPRDSISSD